MNFSNNTLSNPDLDDTEELSLQDKNVLINNLCCDIYYDDVNSPLATSYHNRTLPIEIANLIDYAIDTAESLASLYNVYIEGKCSLATLLEKTPEKYEEILDNFILQLQVNKKILIDKKYLNPSI